MLSGPIHARYVRFLPQAWEYHMSMRVEILGCSTYGSEECRKGKGASYRGTVAVTITGKTCQRWDSQTPHTHDRTPANYPSGGLDENYCRNPDNWYNLWCFTTDPDKRWEYCDVPDCNENQKNIENFEMAEGEWLERDPSLVVDSTGPPLIQYGVTYDAGKALDMQTGTFWNPQNLLAPDRENLKNWYIVLDLKAPHALTRIAVINYGDTIHDIAAFILQKSLSGSQYNWEDVVSVTNVQGGMDQRQEFGGFQETARYWKFVVTRTHSGWQPWLKELLIFGASSAVRNGGQKNG
ncbi:plasminogen-like [Branchiostoma lanceolatum]|uniref:plasminogen-like n=1 Tax=Branchiostoma lanceolatum TaxID=7740 RepID=UPI003454AC20